MGTCGCMYGDGSGVTCYTRYKCAHTTYNGMCCVVHCTKSINRKGVSGDFPPKMGLSFEKIKHHQILVRGTWCLPYRYTYRITRYFGHTTDNRIKFTTTCYCYLYLYHLPGTRGTSRYRDPVNHYRGQILAKKTHSRENHPISSYFIPFPIPSALVHT